jgi:hypothetical protein
MGKDVNQKKFLSCDWAPEKTDDHLTISIHPIALLGLPAASR